MDGGGLVSPMATPPRHNAGPAAAPPNTAPHIPQSSAQPTTTTKTNNNNTMASPASPAPRSPAGGGSSGSISLASTPLRNQLASSTPRSHSKTQMALPTPGRKESLSVSDPALKALATAASSSQRGSHDSLGSPLPTPAQEPLLNISAEQPWALQRAVLAGASLAQFSKLLDDFQARQSSAAAQGDGSSSRDDDEDKDDEDEEGVVPKTIYDTQDMHGEGIVGGVELPAPTSSRPTRVQLASNLMHGVLVR